MWYLLALIGVVVIAAVLAQIWVVREASRQQRRLARRLDDLADRMTGRAELANPNGTPASWFDLPDLVGARVTLPRLLAPRRPLLLLFTDPRCAPCYELLPDIGGWQRVYGDRLTIALVSGGTPEANRAMTAEYGIPAESVLLQTDREVAGAYGASMAPAAVVIRFDGRTHGEVVYGAQAVRQLVADTLGLVLPEAPARHRQTVGVGQQVPALRRPDLDGAPFDLSSLRDETTLLLFWSPGCTHCQELLPAMRAWEADPDGPQMVVVSRGPVALNRDVGLRSTIVLDDDHGIADRFGVMGTPAAVLIDDMGIVASEMAQGTREVRALGARRLATAPFAAE